jgi:hypothetical protein
MKVANNVNPETLPLASTSTLSARNDKSEGNPNPNDDPNKKQGTTVIIFTLKIKIDKIAITRYKKDTNKNCLLSILIRKKLLKKADIAKEDK